MPVPGGRRRLPAGTRRVDARQDKTSLAAPPATAGATSVHWHGADPRDSTRGDNAAAGIAARSGSSGYGRICRRQRGACVAHRAVVC